MTLTLAVDIDGVLADYTAAVALAGGLSPTSGPDEYSMTGGEWFPSREDWLRAHVAVMGNLRELRIIDPAAPERLHGFRDAGMGVVYVTARRETAVTPLPTVREDTQRWLDQHGFPNPDNLVLAHDKTTVDFDVLVDDAPHNLSDALRAGREAVAFDQPYNRGCACSYRVQSIAGLVDRLLR